MRSASHLAPNTATHPVPHTLYRTLYRRAMLLEMYTRDGTPGVCMIAADIYEGIRWGSSARILLLPSACGACLLLPLPLPAGHSCLWCLLPLPACGTSICASLKLATFCCCFTALPQPLLLAQGICAPHPPRLALPASSASTTPTHTGPLLTCPAQPSTPCRSSFLPCHTSLPLVPML